jgi:AcrR family transcriptional regulator
LNTAVQIDGRRLRADQTRRRIALAMIELARAGEVTPSADAVAEAAGVGRRSVFRLFNDMEGLYREMHAVMVERMSPLFAAPFVAIPWRARIDELIERRARMFEDMLPVKSAADANRHRSSFLQSEHRRLTKLQRDALLAVLPRSVSADATRIDALDLAFSFEAWRRLRQEQSLTIKAAIAVWRCLAAALLD